MAADEEDDDGGGIPEWVVTFGDMMSLLLTFFIMLVSLSEIKDEEKYQALVESIKRQLGHSKTVENTTPGNVRPRNSAIQKISSQGRSKRLDVMRGGQPVEAAVGEQKRVTIVRQATRTVVGTTLTFVEGVPDIPPDQFPQLEKQAQQFLGKPQIIEVRGHTTRRPMKSTERLRDHDDLAFERCRQVRDYLINVAGIDPARIRITVAGEHDPVYTGTDPRELLRNPRVEVYELDEVMPGRGNRASDSAASLRP